MAVFSMSELALDQAPWHQLQLLPDSCYLLQPQDFFKGVVATGQSHQRLWLVTDTEGLYGLAMRNQANKLAINYRF